jgi:hypothetical protein
VDEIEFASEEKVESLVLLFSGLGGSAKARCCSPELNARRSTYAS